MNKLIQTSMVVSALLYFGTAQALKIKQNMDDKGLAVIEMNSPTEAKVGDRLLATHEGKQCTLEITKIKNSLALVKTTSCPFKNQLAVGQELEPALMQAELDEEELTTKAEEPPPPVQKKKTSSQSIDSRSSLLIGLVLSSKVKFDVTSTPIGGSTISGTAEYKQKTGFNLGYQWSQFVHNQWNNGFMVSYTKLDTDTLTTSEAIGSVTNSVTESMTLVDVSYTGNYLWNTFYLPVGAGLASATFSGEVPFLGGASGLLTMWLGAGFVITENASIEIQSRATALEVKDSSSSGTVVSGKNGMFSGYFLITKIGF